MPQQKAQLVPQLAHVASCGWCRGDDGSMWRHLSTNHKSPHGRVVTQNCAFCYGTILFLVNKGDKGKMGNGCEGLGKGN